MTGLLDCRVTPGNDKESLCVSVVQASLFRPCLVAGGVFFGAEGVGEA